MGAAGASEAPCSCTSVILWRPSCNHTLVAGVRPWPSRWPTEQWCSPSALRPGRRQHALRLRLHPCMLFPLAFSQCFRVFRAFRTCPGNEHAPAGNQHQAWRKGIGSDPPGELIRMQFDTPAIVAGAGHCFGLPGHAEAVATWWIYWPIDRGSHESFSASHPNRAWRMTGDERSEEQGTEHGRSLATTGRWPGEVEGVGLGSKRLSWLPGPGLLMSLQHQLVIDHVDAGSEVVRLRSRGRGGAGRLGLQGFAAPQPSPTSTNYKQLWLSNNSSQLATLYPWSRGIKKPQERQLTGAMQGASSRAAA